MSSHRKHVNPQDFTVFTEVNMFFFLHCLPGNVTGRPAPVFLFENMHRVVSAK